MVTRAGRAASDQWRVMAVAVDKPGFTREALIKEVEAFNGRNKLTLFSLEVKEVSLLRDDERC